MSDSHKGLETNAIKHISVQQLTDYFWGILFISAIVASKTWMRTCKPWIIWSSSPTDGLEEVAVDVAGVSSTACTALVILFEGRGAG